MRSGDSGQPPVCRFGPARESGGVQSDFAAMSARRAASGGLERPEPTGDDHPEKPDRRPPSGGSAGGINLMNWPSPWCMEEGKLWQHEEAIPR